MGVCAFTLVVPMVIRAIKLTKIVFFFIVSIFKFGQILAVLLFKPDDTKVVHDIMPDTKKVSNRKIRGLKCEKPILKRY
jgi:hypothetical protein